MATATAERRVELVWQPQPGMQHALQECPVFEVCVGGARGGGKTDGTLGEWAVHAQRYGKHAKGLWVRREVTQLEETIARSHELYSPLGANWLEQKKTWVFPGGARLKFRPLENDADAEKYLGHSYTRVYPEELTNYPDARPINKLKATLRSADGVPVGMRSSCNPGGPGHSWVKARYIDPAPSGYAIITDADGNQRVFIPSLLRDNPKLLANDPGYIARLKMSGSAQLVKAWLEGLWDQIEGAFFDCWRAQMVLEPFEIPEHWPRTRALDWGSARPFSVGWWTVALDDRAACTSAGEALTIPRGALVRYAEWYGVARREDGTVDANTGLKLTVEQVRDGIRQREAKMNAKVGVGPADPSFFAADGGPAMSERMLPVVFRRADNTRIARVGHIGGWDQLRARMVGDEYGRAMIYTFDTCTESIRTIPVLQHDDARAEDLDTESEDHAADEWRYMCMSRPYRANVPAAKTPRPRDYGAHDDEREATSWLTA